MTFSFGGQDLSPYIFVSEATRTVAPSRRVDRTEVPGMDGELVRFDGLEAVEITVKGYLTPYGIDQVAKVKRILAKMLTTDEAQALRLPDEPW